MLDGTLIVIISDHGGWRNRHGYRKPFSALVDIPILIRGKWPDRAGLTTGSPASSVEWRTLYNTPR